MMEKEMLKRIVKEIWEREEGIKSAFYNACEMYLCIKKRSEGEGYDEYKEEDTNNLNLLWGGIIGVLSCSGVNEYIDLDLDVKDEGIEVFCFIDGEAFIIDSFNIGNYWVSHYKNGISQYWEMANF